MKLDYNGVFKKSKPLNKEKILARKILKRNKNIGF
jgi:hypothetical protein